MQGCSSYGVGVERRCAAREEQLLFAASEVWRGGGFGDGERCPLRPRRPQRPPRLPWRAWHAQKQQRPRRPSTGRTRRTEGIAREKFAGSISQGWTANLAFFSGKNNVSDNVLRIESERETRDANEWQNDSINHDCIQCQNIYSVNMHDRRGILPLK
jgi:hypothetical protein